MWVTIFVTGCAGLSDYLPTGPVLGPEDLATFESEPPENPVEFNGAPVLPFQVFGLHYERDLVLETRHSTVSMLELASIVLSDEDTAWIAKIAEKDGTQTLVSDREEILTWMPEVNAPRLHQPKEFSVNETSQGEVLLQLQLPQGELLEASAVLKPLKHPRNTNSSTFNHSEHIAMAILEVSGKRLGLRASLSIDGRAQAFRRVLGMIPVKALLEQTQGGILTADMQVSQHGNSLELLRPETWAVPGVQTCEILLQEVVCTSELGATHYRYSKGGFSSAEVLNSRGSRLFMLELDTPMPEITQELEGEHRHRFVVHIGEIRGAGHGEILLQRQNDSIHLTLTPKAPRWFAARPMLSRIQFHPDKSYRLQTSRIRDGH